MRNKNKNKEKKQRKKHVMTKELVKFIFQNKCFIIATVYQLLPIDMLPDAIPVIGQIDDLFVLVWGCCNLLTVYSGGSAVEMPSYIQPSGSNIAVNMMQKGLQTVTDKLQDSQYIKPSIKIEQARPMMSQEEKQVVRCVCGNVLQETDNFCFCCGRRV